MNVESTHLDLEALLAEASGKPTNEEAKAHLAGCPACRGEVERWATVASGVRELVTATPAPTSCWPNDGSFGHVAAPMNAAPSGRKRGAIRRLPRGALVAGAVAAVLLIGAGSYSLTAGLGGSGHRPAPGGGSATVSAGLTVVNGCSALDATSGTLEQVNGSDLVIKTANGQTVTAATSTSTKVRREVKGSVSDIHDGTQVFVKGTDANGTIAAQNVGVGMAGGTGKRNLPKFPRLSGRAGRVGVGRLGLQLGLIRGTVADATTGGFTVVESNGTRVPVTTTNSTTVVTLTAASVSSLQTGEFTVAVGTSGPGGTLKATSVEQEPILPAAHPRPTLPGGQHLQLPRFGQGGGIGNLPNLGCSASTVATAALLSAG